MYLTIDHGNSRTKTGVFDDQGKLIRTDTFAGNTAKRIQDIIEQYHVTHLIISSTGKRDWDANELKGPNTFIDLSHETPLPIDILYFTPHTLGRDRMAAACGAHALYPKENCLIIDAGTCITMDLLLASGIYIGGNIAPGLYMRLKAMHDQTSGLPLAEPGWPELTFGDSTLHALQNGACLGMVMEIEGILNRAMKAYGTVSIVITGGDCNFLADRIESQIFVEPELVTQGLFQILSFNAKNV